MPTSKTRYQISEKEYLIGELDSDIKHEYIDGEVYAMVGAKIEHIRITGNLSRELGNHLKGKACSVFASDLKVKVGDNYYYPDVVVDCSVLEYGATFTENPVIVVEVLSESTRRVDRTHKKMEYMTLETLMEYVLIEQDICKVEVYRRRDDWKPTYYTLGENVDFESIDVRVSVEEIYDRIKNNDMLSFSSYP